MADTKRQRGGEFDDYPSEGEVQRLMKEADERGLCPNCFHTLACCDSYSACPTDIDGMAHVCIPNPAALRAEGESSP